MNKNIQQAFHWIIKILRIKKIPFRISGGLAAYSYGSKRDIHDIDIDLPDKEIEKLMPLLRKFKVIGPNYYKDKEWEVYYISIDYKGQDVDLVGSNSQRIFNKNARKWEKFKINLNNVEKKKIFGLYIPVITKSELINYKSKIRRPMDLLDIKNLT